MRKPRRTSRSLDALAYADAVRDILATDGAFRLYDRERGDAVWEWDGVRWTRLELMKRLIHSSNDHGADEDAELLAVQAADDLAVAS